MSLAVTTDQAFDQDVLHSARPVLVEFTADWCGPCRMVAPTLEKISLDEADRLKVVVLDVDANPQTALRYEVLGMPTMALFSGGEMVARMMGARSRSAIMREVEPHLAPQ